MARITHWTRDQAWLHIRALRERKGKALRDRPYGGVTLSEVNSCFQAAGWELKEAWAGRKRMRYDDFCRDYGRQGHYLCLQHDHFFAHKKGERPTYPHAVIIRAWRITRKRKEAVSAPAPSPAGSSPAPQSSPQS